MSENRSDNLDPHTDDNKSPFSFSSFTSPAEISAAAAIRRTAYQIGGRDGRAIDDSWLPASRTVDRFSTQGVVNVTAGTLRRRLKKATPSPTPRIALGENNNEVEFYHSADSLGVVEDLAELDRLNRRLDSSGTVVLQSHHFDPEKPHPLDTATIEDVGKTFSTLPIIAAKNNVSEPVALRRSRDVKRVVVRLVTGKQAFVYEVSPIESRLKEELTNIRETRKVQVDENGYYLDEEGKKWCTINAFWDSLDAEVQKKTSISAVTRRAQSECSSLDALDREKRPKCKIYPLEELQKISILANEKVAGKDGFYNDAQNGKQWASFKKWLSVFRISNRALDYGIDQTFGGIEKMPKLPVLDSTRKEVEMLERKDVEKALADIFDAEALEVNNVYTKLETIEGETRESIYVTMGELTDLIPTLKRNYMKEHLMPHKEDATERASGAPVYTYSLSAATAKFKDRIAELLAAIEKTDDSDEVTDDKGRWVTISKFLNERREAEAPIENPRRLISHTDQAQRIRRMNSQNQLTYLYLESELISLT